MRTVAIIQARLGSTRLPNKMLLPLLDKPLMQHVIERVKRSTHIKDVILAIPKEPDSHLLEAVANTTDCICYRFDHIPAEDLVSRYLGAAKAYGADILVRIPGDNPCVDPAYLDAAIAHYLARPIVWYSNTTAECCMTWMDGLGGEISSYSRWCWLEERIAQERSVITQKIYREHPHLYFYDHDDMFGHIQINGRYHRDAIRLDVNTQADYEFIQDIFNHFGHNHFDAADIVSYLTTKEASHESKQRREQPGERSNQGACRVEPQ